MPNENEKKNEELNEEQEINELKAEAENGEAAKSCDNCEELENKYKRALADYQNLLKQTALEKQEFVRFANSNLLEEIIPVYDHLKLALKHANCAPAEETGKNTGNGVEEGLKFVLKQFKQILEDNGISEIETIGKEYDHNTMEAADKKATDDKGLEGKVAEEVKAGYVLNGKVIVPARVIVYEYEKG